MIEIVRLKPEHLEKLKAFFERINTPEYIRNFSPHHFDAPNAERVCGYRGRDVYCAVLLDGATVIGYGMLRGWDEGYDIPSLGLCVLKEYQGAGLGRLLTAFLEAASRLEGASRAMLKVKKDNAAARRLYETQGFVFKEYNEEFLIGYKELKVRR